MQISGIKIDYVSILQSSVKDFVGEFQKKNLIKLMQGESESEISKDQN